MDKITELVNKYELDKVDAGCLCNSTELMEINKDSIAQWVIDNRYPKSEFNKVSDMEMYHEIVGMIEKLINKTNDIPDVSHSTTPSYLNDKYKVVPHILDTYQVEKNGYPVFRGEKEDCHQYIKDELGYCD